MSWGGAERKRIPSRLHSVSTEPNAGLDLWDHNLSQDQESDASPTEPPRRPILKMSISSHTALNLTVVYAFICAGCLPGMSFCISCLRNSWSCPLPMSLAIPSTVATGRFPGLCTRGVSIPGEGSNHWQCLEPLAQGESKKGVQIVIGIIIVLKFFRNNACPPFCLCWADPAISSPPVVHRAAI